MADDPDAKSDFTYNPWSNWPSLKQTLRIVALLIFALVAGYGILVALFVYSTRSNDTFDIVDYPEMRDYMLDRYPWSPAFLPAKIPESAVIGEFFATDTEFLQGSPSLTLTYTLSEEEALIEIKRLNALNPSTDEIGQLHFVTANSPDKFASVYYEPTTNTFDYHIGSD